MQTVSKNGMTLSWQLTPDRIRLRMTAPTDGWIAIGFNTKDELSGTNLLMGAVEKGTPVLSDRYILAPGHHERIEDLGGRELAELIEATEQNGTTSIEFWLPLNSGDKFHHLLQKGHSYNLLMAFSREDDFAHHSMMRTSIQISL